MSTKKVIADSVLLKLAGGIPDSAFPVKDRDVFLAIDRRINAKFRLKQLDTNLPLGETIPDNLNIAVYENVAVTSIGEKSKSTLPITPISLPREMGIFQIYDPNNPDFPFIPTRRGQRALMRTDSIMSDLFGQITYEPNNKTITYSKDITLFGVDAVTMELVVFDISQYSTTENLPIPADYLAELHDELIAEFAPVLPESGLVNNVTTQGQNEGGKK